MKNREKPLRVVNDYVEAAKALDEETSIQQPSQAKLTTTTQHNLLLALAPDICGQQFCSFIAFAFYFAKIYDKT